MDIREELEQKLRERGAGDLSAAADQELYHALLELVAQRLEQAPRIQGIRSSTTSPPSFWWASSSPTTSSTWGSTPR